MRDKTLAYESEAGEARTAVLAKYPCAAVAGELGPAAAGGGGEGGCGRKRGGPEDARGADGTVTGAAARTPPRRPLARRGRMGDSSGSRRALVAVAPAMAGRRK